MQSNDSNLSKREDFKKQISSISNELKRQTETFIRNHSKSFVSLYLVDNFDQLCGEASSEMLSLFNSLKYGVRKSRIGRAIEETINKRQKFFIGMDMKDFTLSDHLGNEVQLSQIDGKAILVDFGASWCGPCRYEYPFLKKMYENYQAKGLEIVSVSHDKDKKAWLKSISEDKLPWIQLSDLKGFQTEAAVLYDVKAIPSNFLIDKFGKIQSVDRNGEDLQKRVIALLNQ